jgi:5'-nucleotidase
MEEYKEFDDVVAYTECDLETRFTKIRRQESNYGNFLADLARLYYDSDVAAINAGMVRNDVLINSGRLTYSKISNIIDSPMVVKKVTGKTILDMLELSVATYPQFSGQFLFLSGVRFEFDPDSTPRVKTVTIGDQPLKE